MPDRPLEAPRHPLSQSLHHSRTFGERLADAASAAIGSWEFLIVQSILVALWIVANIVGLRRHWDPYPFVLLNLLFSVQAAYTGPVLLLSANRAAQRDRIMAEHDFTTNQKAEQLVESVMSELLRNSRITLAIAQHLQINEAAVEEHGKALEQKFDQVQTQLAEIEDVVEEHATENEPSGDLER